ncbi:hypothetical protein M6B38_300790 [Iris pallida]|uniref:Uncharacterized protein n=1 Tax=Iris pallida TaxID=29817 RepID=A0AAX6HQD9_IRIPA|nr:hypothetical protein M6B38_300790 [Iris pallida]
MIYSFFKDDCSWIIFASLPNTLFCISSLSIVAFEDVWKIWLLASSLCHLELLDHTLLHIPQARYLSQLSEEDMQKFKNVIRWIDYIQFLRLKRVTRGQEPPPHIMLQEHNKRNKVCGTPFMMASMYLLLMHDMVSRG